MNSNQFKNIDSIIIRKKIIKRLIKDGYNITSKQIELYTDGKMLNIVDESNSVFESVCIDKYIDPQIRFYLSLIFSDSINEEKELVTIKSGYCEMLNYLTITIDLYIKKYIEGFCTYIYNEPYDDNTWLIRYPGKTVGNIKVDKDNTILEINIYNDINMYQDDVKKYISTFVGYKMILDKGDREYEDRT